MNGKEISRSFEMSDRKEKLPRWAFPDLSDEEYDAADLFATTPETEFANNKLVECDKATTESSDLED